MPKYIYVGSQAEVVGTPHVFTHFGQEVDLTDESATALVLVSGIHLLPAAQFTVGMAAPEAWRAHDAFRASLQSPQPKIAPVAPAIEESTNV